MCIKTKGRVFELLHSSHMTRLAEMIFITTEILLIDSLLCFKAAYDVISEYTVDTAIAELVLMLS